MFIWHKHNLIISSLVGSCHPDKYLYEIIHEYLFEGISCENNFN